MDGSYKERAKNDEGELYKPESTKMGGGMRGGDSATALVYTDDAISSDSSIFDNAKTKTDDDDHNRVILAIYSGSRK